MKILIRSFAALLAAVLTVTACDGSGKLLFNAVTANVQKIGDGQTGLATYPLNIPPAVKVRDGSGHPLAGVQVTFAVTSGGGSITGGAATTGSDGIAAVGSWTVPLGVNTLSATVPRSSGPVSFTATGVTAAYTIDVRFLTTPTPSRQAAFDSAAAHWERLIYGDVIDIPLSEPGDTLKKYCNTGKITPPDLNETVDDILIYAVFDSIDGPGGIIGRAGFCIYRQNGFQPVVGAMTFDTADVANLEAAGKFDETVLHEMGHVLGFGTTWGSFYDNLLVGGGGIDPHFVGTQATNAFNRIGGTGYTAGLKVPVENTGGLGTRDSHWRKTVFGPELMTGILSGGVPNPLSVVTVASMGDEGYQVNYAAADPFSLTLAAAFLRGQGATTEIQLGDDILHLPKLGVDARGRIMEIRAPR